MWAKYKMCRAIKGGLLAELSILLRESFIKSSKRQGLSPAPGTLGGTHAAIEMDTAATHALPGRKCVCDNARAPYVSA